jgi:hypothetical protein
VFSVGPYACGLSVVLVSFLHFILSHTHTMIYTHTHMHTYAFIPSSFIRTLRTRTHTLTLTLTITSTFARPHAHPHARTHNTPIGKLFMAERKWALAYRDFNEAFDGSDETAQRAQAILNLKYLVVACLLNIENTNVNPFAAARTKSYESDVEIRPLKQLVVAFQRTDIFAFERTLADHHCSLVEEPFLRVGVDVFNVCVCVCVCCSFACICTWIGMCVCVCPYIDVCVCVCVCHCVVVL